MAAPTRGPTYKVVLLGELGVGKTSLFRRLKENTFDEYQTATTGIDSCTKVVKVDGETVMVSVRCRPLGRGAVKKVSHIKIPLVSGRFQQTECEWRSFWLWSWF